MKLVTRFLALLLVASVCWSCGGEPELSTTEQFEALAAKSNAERARKQALRDGIPLPTGTTLTVDGSNRIQPIDSLRLYERKDLRDGQAISLTTIEFIGTTWHLPICNLNVDSTKTTPTSIQLSFKGEGYNSEDITLVLRNTNTERMGAVRKAWATMAVQQSKICKN